MTPLLGKGLLGGLWETVCKELTLSLAQKRSGHVHSLFIAGGVSSCYQARQTDCSASILCTHIAQQTQGVIREVRGPVLLKPGSLHRGHIWLTLP